MALAVLGAAGVLRAQEPAGVEGPLTCGPPKPAQAADPRAVSAPPTAAPASSKPIIIDDDTILRMFKAGFGDDLLVQTIQLQPGHYDTSPDALIALKQAGISDRVISTIQAHSTGLAVRANRPATALAPSPQSVGAASSEAADTEPGVYYKDKQGHWMLMENEIVHIKSGGFIKSTLTHNIIKEDQNGVVSGREAKLILPRPIEFMIVAREGVAAEEYNLLLFRLNSKDREFRTLTGGVIHSTGGAKRDEVTFNPVRVASHTWTFTLDAKTPGGEYGILPPGTGNVTNGGKIYTFAITE